MASSPADVDAPAGGAVDGAWLARLEEVLAEAPADLAGRVMPAAAGEGGSPPSAGQRLSADPATPSRAACESAVERSLARARPALEGGAFAVIDRSGARTSARWRDGGTQAGPLHGTVLAVKDLIAVAGMCVRAGSPTRAEAPVEVADAPVVASLRQAGAIVVGTTGLDEIAFGVTGLNAHSGTPRHPQDRRRITGGSSAGSALAVAEGSADIALGTDTGGSVRIPAALCGVVGFKPSFGAYPTEGVLRLAPSLDHVGLLARSVREVVDAHAVLGGAAPAQPARGRLGFCPTELDGCSAQVRKLLEGALEALRDLGWEVVAIDWPDLGEVFAVSTTILFSEAARVHGRAVRDGAPYGPEAEARLRLGMSIPARLYVAACCRREELVRRVRRQLEEVDAVLGPTVGMTAPTFEEARNAATSAALVANTRLANITGLPAASLPLRTRGLPVGLQVVAGDDGAALGMAQAVERDLALGPASLSGPGS